MLEDSIEELESLIRALESDWESARHRWRDEVGRGFDERYRRPLSEQSQAVWQRLVRLEELIRSAQREIES